MFFRKQKRANSGPSETASSQPGAVNSKGLFSLSKSRSKTSFDSEQERGPGNLGLSILHCPENPTFDFIFVHGLGGDSKKTWSKSGLNFWPQEWLPKDIAFDSVRVHTYGYSSDYRKGRGDCLNIHHFGKGLLAAISTSPYLANSDTHIVAIGHSLGGLVIKKAYMLAKYDAIHAPLADRFAAIYFLATPHRGADSAKLLKNILRVAYDRPYVGDLKPSSSAIQVINDEFRHVSTDLGLWSFYETQHMKMFGSLIVEPESALLGYREENQIPMAADHRSICKFDTPSDPNYTLLRNALASTVSAASNGARPETKYHDMKQIGKYLEAAEILDDEISELRELRQESSCRWILNKKEFVDWKDGSIKEHQVLWIKGKPASGKSVLASFIIDDLQQTGKACTFFFFKHGDKSKSTLHRCLRHCAYQMSDVDTGCRQELLRNASEGVQLSHMDERTIWRMIFQSGILQEVQSTHFLVIDALDECSNASVFFDTVLPSLHPNTPLKILFLSRDTPFINQGLSSIHITLSCISIVEEDTLPDLRRIIEGKIRLLPAVGTGSQNEFVENILNKSKGSFLWTILVLKELANCYTSNDVKQVLDDVPKGMVPLYKRTLSLMESAPRSKALSKAILLWTSCAIRPMTILELNGALKMDLNDVFPQLQDSIVALCGQLVMIDKSGRVQMIHETAREFLLSQTSESEFSIHPKAAHTHMAKVCLQYLTGDEMRPPRIMRRRNSAGIGPRDDFAFYTYNAYSYHLSKADPASLELFHLVELFLKSNVLTWIEAVASKMDLKQLIRSSNHLRTYANACAIEHSPVNKRVQDLQQWPRDLARVTAMFSPALVSVPSAIHSIVPPLCPQNSQLHKTSGGSRRLKVLGRVNEQWDDRLLGINFHRGQPSSMCYGEDFLAVGLTTGTVHLYHVASYQEYRVINHGESVNHVAFKKKTALLGTCGLKSVKLWNFRTGEELFSFKSPPRPLELQFQGNLLMVASHKNFIASWDITEEDQPQCMERSWVERDDGKPAFGTAGTLALSEAHKMLAVAYNGRPITIWDTEEASIIGTCGKKLSTGETSTHPVTAMVFNPNASIGLLAATYLDGNLTLLDPLEDKQVECFRANCQSLAASPNGRLLAAGGADGIIHVFEFDTLKLLYKVKSQNSFIKKLCFAKDSFIFADIRGTRCTVWEPEAMLRDSLGDDSSGITNNSTIEITAVDSTANITTISSSIQNDMIFCGKDDGTVAGYSPSTATCLGIICKHKVAIRHLKSWEQEQKVLILSIDIANRILLHSIPACSKSNVTAAILRLEIHLEATGAITDLLLNGPEWKMLLSTAESDYLVDINYEKTLCERTLTSRVVTQADRKWVDHPTDATQMVCISREIIEIYSWNKFTETRTLLFKTPGIMVDFLQLRNAIPIMVREVRLLVLELFDPTRGTVCIGALENFESTQTKFQQGRHDVATADTEGFADTSEDGSDGLLPRMDGENESLRFCEVKAENLNISYIIGGSSSGSLVFLSKDSWEEEKCQTLSPIPIFYSREEASSRSSEATEIMSADLPDEIDENYEQILL
ncbi:hypothetical protein NLG97_g4905 [Lecanicillium saksenae]|uniref:Uncharacterized protein n=1 Tax=Lecanicillium saksenae TaxID=468837 RepID=A0ACC1QXV4_9HYPO|nr:hypothetical protein NLG97_g4905 [Lecanicillium saksenae]